VVPAPPQCASRTRQTERWVVAVVVVAMAVFSFWLSSNRTWDPNYAQTSEAFNADFFRQQAIAMLDGRLDVPDAGFDSNECFDRDDRCYGYFGLVPSVVRLGAFALARSTDPNPGPVVVAVGAAVALWAAIDLALRVATSTPAGSRLTSRSRLVLIGITALVLGPGGLLVYFAQAKLYYEPIMGMVAGLLVCFTFVYRWLEDRVPRHLVVAIVAAVVATNSRPAALLPTIVVGLGVVAVAWRRGGAHQRRDAALGVVLAAVPTVSALGVVWLKLRTFIPSLTVYRGYGSPGTQAMVAANDGDLTGLRFLPTNLANYLRPDTLGIDGTWPWFRHLLPLEKGPILLPPMVRQGIYVEYSASLTNTMPVALALTVGFTVLVVVGVVRLTSSQRIGFGLLMGAAATAPVAILTNYLLATRYLADFFPLVAVGTVFALVSVLEATQRRPTLNRLVIGALALSGVVTTAVNLNLWEQGFSYFG